MGTVTSIGELPHDLPREARMDVAGHLESSAMVVLAILAGISGFLVGSLLIGALWLFL